MLARTLPKNVAGHIGVEAEPKFFSVIRGGIVSALPATDDSDIIDAELIEAENIELEV